MAVFCAGGVLPWVLAAGALAAVLSILAPVLLGAVWLPMPRKKLREAMAMAGLRPGELVLDLGCGGGRLLRILAEELDARAVGYEIDPVKAVWGWARNLFSPARAHIQLRWGNFMDADVSRADVILSYTSREAMARLAPKLEREARPEARIVSYEFLIDGWTPVACNAQRTIFLYRPDGKPRFTAEG